MLGGIAREAVLVAVINQRLDCIPVRNDPSRSGLSMRMPSRRALCAFVPTTNSRLAPAEEPSEASSPPTTPTVCAISAQAG